VIERNFNMQASTRTGLARARHLGPAIMAAAILALPQTAVGQSAEPNGLAEPLSVVTAFYPIAEAAREVGGAAVVVTDLTPVGGGPHDLELTPQDIERLDLADVVLYVGAGFQPQVEKAADELQDGARSLDVLSTVELLPVDPQVPGTVGEVDGEVLAGGMDPHIWLDPVRFAQMADAIAAELTAADPAHTAEFAANAAAYRHKLEALDGAFADSLADCESRAIVTSHRAFGYFADRYDLLQLPIAGLSPDQEPDPRSLEAVAAAARDHGVTTIFFETRVPRAFAATVAREVGATTDALEPIETLTQQQLDLGLDYTTLMDENRLALVRGLRCSAE